MTPKRLPIGTSVRITWEDSQSKNGWFFPLEDLTPPADLVSVGFTARQGRSRFLTLTSTVAKTGDIISPLMIPWSAIKKLEVLLLPECTKKTSASTKAQ